MNFSHTLYRDNGHPELLDKIELAVSVTIYAGEPDEITWTPDIAVTPAEHDSITAAAWDALAEHRQEEADYRRDLAAEEHFYATNY